jgi:hypothetical protein
MMIELNPLARVDSHDDITDVQDVGGIRKMDQLRVSLRTRKVNRLKMKVEVLS